MTLVYADDDGYQTVQEVFLPSNFPRIPGATPETEYPAQQPPAKPRTQSDLIKILQVLSDVVNVLEVAHHSGITHNNVNTFSIIAVAAKNGERIRGKLGGWHLASKLEREEMGRVAGGAILRGENPAPLQYIAPECTGRMNSAVDRRADFYSLGITMYELVVGYLPFRSAEPLELIHMHIAQQPKPPNEVNASIPAAISAIVMKLLKKNAEERYQTGSGLQADLDLMIRLLKEGKSLDSVKIGELDTSSTFLISEKLYGRENDIKQLKDAYESCLKSGGCTIVMIQGPSGVGKSRLVNEIQRPVVEKKGYVFFTSGKFDQYKSGFSFFTLIQTLQDLIRQVLSESPASLARWRTDIIRAFDDDVAVLIEVIPELGILLGPDYQIKPLADLGPAERESRFRNAIGRLLFVFGRKGVVIFLDDLQWCSQSEFMLIANIADETNRRVRNWNYEETDMGATSRQNSSSTPPQSTTSLFSMLDYIKTIGVQVVDIHLTPLDQDSVRRIIGDTLHRDPESKNMKDDPEMQTLAELVFAKTQGNPFFVVQLLKSLHRAGHIFFEFSSPSGGQWRFNLTSIEANELPPTVVELLVKQMNSLSKETREVMKLASCIGTERISLAVLANAAGKRVEETAHDLWSALEGGLILPTGGNYQIHLIFDGAELRDRKSDSSYSPRITDAEEEVTYRFLHDRVRQAAYSLIKESERPGLHRTIGLRMLETATEEQLNEGLIYEVVNQLNNWLSPLNPQESKLLMELNLRAGKKALKSTAFFTALNYFQVAKEVLDSDNGEALKNSLDELGTEINISLMEAYFADVKYTQSIKLAEEILPRCGSPRDKVRCLINKMNCLLIQGKLNEAIESGLQGLSILNWEIPMDDVQAARHADMLRPKILMDEQQIKAIRNIHELKDENMLLLQEIIATLILPVYMGRPKLLEAMCFTSVAITLEHGISMPGTYPILMTGVVLSVDGTRANLGRSYAYGKLAIDLIERDNRLHPLAPALYQVYAGHIAVFHQKMSDALQYLQRAVTSGTAVFNVDYTIFAMAELTSYAMLSGRDLQTVQNEMMATKPNIKRFKQETGMWWLSLPLQFLLNLRGLGNSDPLSFEGNELGHESLQLLKLGTSESLSHIYLYHMYRLIIAAIYNEWKVTVDLATQCCAPLANSMLGSLYTALAGWYSAVAFYELYDTLSAEQMEMLQKSASHIKEYARRARSTWEHKSRLLDAEHLKATNSGQQLQILDMYDEAIGLANKYGFIHDAAFINERCGTWLHELSRRRSVPYIREAYRLYIAWGASHKANEIRKKYPDELMIIRGTSPHPAASAPDLVAAILPASSSPPPLPRKRKRFLDELSADQRPGTSTASVPGPMNPRQDSDIATFSPRQSPRSSRIGTGDYGFDTPQPPPPMPMQSSTSLGSCALFTETKDDDLASHTDSNANNDSSLGSELDYRTVLKASLLISEGIRLEEVIESLMRSVLQTAGADYAVLILKEEGELHVETVGLLDQVSILEHEPLHTRPDLVPISVVNIVASLGEQILRNGDDSKFELTYGRDAYFQTKRPKSVLCMPIRNQIKTLGVLYLENKLVNHAFTRQRLELLNLLCTQAAVTIDKARLYRQMELAKKAAEEMTAEKSTFLANMSHEIRTPFNSLLSCSIFLLDTELTEQQREYVETIRGSAVLTLQIIDGILDFSKIEHGAIDLQSTPFSLRDCVESALQLVAEPAATKEIELAYRNKCSYIDLIYGDITRWRQVIINLIGNAVKFTQAGHIVVTTTAQELPEGRYKIEASVSDTGIGIPESAHSKLFRAFSQVDSSTRRTYGGTGLGLVISKKLAQMMGGDIWFESKEGEGTTFHFTVVVPEVITKVWKKDKRLEGKYAIVADTHPISGNILADELEVEGLTISRPTTVAAVSETLKAHPKSHFAVALVDLSVDPSYHVLDIIAKYDPSIKIILMSRFGSTIPATILNNKCTLSFVRPAPRKRYVEAVIDALNPGRRKKTMKAKLPELEIMRSLGTRHPLNILLAEDNPVNTRVALQHLKRMGYTAIHAKDGIEVLEICEKAAAEGNMFDVILMDIFMPRADGIETSRELYRRYPDGERPAIIALTANATASDRERCHEAGMLTHVAKPILPNDLATALMAVERLCVVKEKCKNVGDIHKHKHHGHHHHHQQQGQNVANQDQMEMSDTEDEDDGEDTASSSDEADEGADEFDAPIHVSTVDGDGDISLSPGVYAIPQHPNQQAGDPMDLDDDLDYNPPHDPTGGGGNR
ncbi:hypothetical protein EX30DRAFT_308148 [Ascodesmis nigricans]|uniref:histidine kinase n=1 Tax=Ascodesmis nigricans TaxID=341454 RepID=A0A4S2MU56_9PEZI|nr:hypothetical protein EX30DRAFT_308148 [Ascodesmis nigricans]